MFLQNVSLVVYGVPSNNLYITLKKYQIFSNKSPLSIPSPRNDYNYNFSHRTFCRHKPFLLSRRHAQHVPHHAPRATRHVRRD